MGRESVGGEGQRESGCKARMPHRQGVMHRVKPSSRVSKRARPSVRPTCSRSVRERKSDERVAASGASWDVRGAPTEALERPLRPARRAGASKVDVRAREGRSNARGAGVPGSPSRRRLECALPVTPAYLHCSVHPLTTCRWRATPLSLCQSPLLPLTASSPHLRVPT